MAISASIQALISGATVAGSKLSKGLLTELMNEGLLQITTHGSRKSYRARDIEALKDISLTRMRITEYWKSKNVGHVPQWLKTRVIPNLSWYALVQDFQSTAMNLLIVHWAISDLWSILKKEVCVCYRLGDIYNS